MSTKAIIETMIFTIGVIVIFFIILYARREVFKEERKRQKYLRNWYGYVNPRNERLPFLGNSLSAWARGCDASLAASRKRRR